MPQPHRILRISAAIAIFSSFFPPLIHAGTWVAFQNSYTRGTGAPVTVISTFTLLNPNTQYTLKAYNGGLQNDTTELVSNSVVYLNGAQVVGPANFNQSVAEVNVTILPGLTNTLSVQVRGKPGGILTIQVIGVDNDPPTISASLSPTPNATGWNNSPVVVTFTCSDKTSGVASCPSPVTISAEGANQPVSGTATDLAGNTASTTVTVNLDMTPPTITGTINPPPDAGGYNSGPVTVTFSCADAVSGVASCSPSVTFANEGPNQTATGAGVDFAGNTATTTVNVNISFNYFKIRSWQTNPQGDPLQTGKCLDYGSQGTGGATVYLNDCSSAHPIRVVEVQVPKLDSNGNPVLDSAGNPVLVPRPGSGGTPLTHEVMLFAGNLVIGIHNPVGGTITTTGTTSPGTATGQTEYALESQVPWNSPKANALDSIPANQIFRLDGDSIILEGDSVDPTTNLVVPGPCIGTDALACPAPPPQLVIQVQNARGANGSPLVVSVRNLSDNEFWDFVPSQGSRPYPTGGFASVSSPDTLWNAICADIPQASPAAPALAECTNFKAGWGGVVIVALAPPNYIDLSTYPPVVLPTGVTLRGNRRGLHVGPPLFFSDAFWQTYLQQHSLSISREGCNEDKCMLKVHGDYVRVTGLTLTGESLNTDDTDPKTIGIQVDYPGALANPPAPLFNLSTVTHFIATIDHNLGSHWGESPVEAQPIFSYDPNHNPNQCQYPYSNPISTYTCDQYVQNEIVPYPASYTPPSPPPNGCTSLACYYANDPGTLANIRISRNYLLFNQRDKAGYGASVRGRALIEGNTFAWNHHDISADAEPHNEYRALNNLVLTGAFNSYGFAGFNGRLQDFDMHGTDNANYPILGSLFVGGAGGYYVEIGGNTFLGGDGHDYVLRGWPVVNSYYHDNVSRRKETDAVHFYHCIGFFTAGCINDYNSAGTVDSSGLSGFPITISNSVFGQSNSSPPDPTATLGVGDFDGDGDDDLFMATGAGWYFSPAGQLEWRYLNSAPDTIDQLLLGDFDGDGRTDVVGMRNGKLYVSWGGISGFDLLNSTVPANCTMANMAVGDFNGVGRKTDIFCAAWQQSLNTYIWWISYGGNTTFTQVNSSAIPPNAFRFGHFAVCGTGAETDVFSVQSTGWYVSCGATTLWQPLGVALTQMADGLVVADFNGDGFADVGMPCGSGGTPGWKIFYGGAQGWSTCNTFSPPFGSPALANGAVGRFSGGPGADLRLWIYYNSQGAAKLWDIPGGTGTPYALSPFDPDMH